MAEGIAPIVLVGTTTVGKTDIAKALVDQTGGHLVNSDRHYLYASDELCLGLGLEKGELHDGTPRHIFGGLDPFLQPPSPTDYLGIAVSEINQIHESGHLAIVEGCTRRYAFELMRHYGLKYCVNITWETNDDIADRVRRRIIALSLKDRLLNETKSALDRGIEGTFPMGAVMYAESINVLSGKLSRQEAEDEMVKQWMAIIERHDSVYANIPDLSRYSHDKTKTQNLASEILKQLKIIQPELADLVAE